MPHLNLELIMINQNTLGKQISQDTDQNESLLPSIKHNRKSKIIKLYVSIALAMIVWFLPRSIFPFEVTIVEQRVAVIFVLAACLWITEAIFKSIRYFYLLQK